MKAKRLAEICVFEKNPILCCGGGLTDGFFKQKTILYEILFSKEYDMSMHTFLMIYGATTRFAVIEWECKRCGKFKTIEDKLIHTNKDLQTIAEIQHTCYDGMKSSSNLNPLAAKQITNKSELLKNEYGITYKLLRLPTYMILNSKPTTSWLSKTIAKNFVYLVEWECKECGVFFTLELSQDEKTLYIEHGCDLFKMPIVKKVSVASEEGLHKYDIGFSFYSAYFLQTCDVGILYLLGIKINCPKNKALCFLSYIGTGIKWFFAGVGGIGAIVGIPSALWNEVLKIAHGL